MSSLIVIMAGLFGIFFFMNVMFVSQDLYFEDEISQTALAFEALIALLAATFYGTAIKQGWTWFFIGMAVLLGIAQLVRYENIARAVIWTLVVGQSASAVAAFVKQAKACNVWDWKALFTGLLFIPIIEVVIFYLCSFISREIDDRRARTS